MRSRYSSGSNFAYSFGPGPVTPAVKALLIINIAVFLLQQVVRELPLWFGLRPIDVVAGLQVWQTLTYMFLHGSISHILFNMLSLWMFGTELERMWGTRFFARYYLVCGVGAAATTILVSFFPGAIGERLYDGPSIVGASGAIYGLLLAYALYLPGPADPDVVPLPGAGEVLRDDHRRDRVPVGGGERRRRHRARDPSWRAARGVALPAWQAGAAGRGNPVPVQPLAHQPVTEEVRRAPGRASASRPGPAHSLSLGG